MPTIITHAVVGIGLGQATKADKWPLKFWLLSIILPVLPDVDALTFKFGIEYGSFFGHRGFFHSLLFAFIIAVLVMLVFYRKDELSSKKWLLLFGYFFLITSSHGILDALTDGGLGIALLSPFSTARYFFPITPIAVAPLRLGAFFSERGLHVLFSEIKIVWLPLAFIVILAEVIKKIHQKKMRRLIN
jgi:inner membrane protein